MVDDEFRYIECRGGTKDGWRYMIRATREKYEPPEGAERVTYRPTGVFDVDDEGRLFEVYVPEDQP